jgi:putative sterol carrier protein
MTAPTLSMRQLVEGMALAFDHAAGQEPSAVLELSFTGDDRGTYQLVMGNGACRFEPGPVLAPTLRVETEAEVWRAVFEGRLQAMAAVRDGRMKVVGDLQLFQQLPLLFRRMSPGDLRAPPGQRPPGPLRLPAMAWLFLGLLPWKVFWVLTAIGDPQRAVLVAMLVAGVLLAARETTGGATFLERATGLVFAAAGAASLIGAPPPPGVVGASFLALAGIWAASVVHARYPLTAEYARWNYVPRLWSTGLFRHPNTFLTLFWSCIFTLLALPGAAAARGWVPHPVATALSIAICAGAGEFTRRHERGARYRRIDDLDAGLVRFRTVARLLLGIIAGGFLLMGDPGTPSGWLLVPAGTLVVVALWRQAGQHVSMGPVTPFRPGPERPERRGEMVRAPPSPGDVPGRLMGFGPQPSHGSSWDVSHF